MAWGGGFEYNIVQGTSNTGFPEDHYGYSFYGGIGTVSGPDIYVNYSTSKTVPRTRFNIYDVIYSRIEILRRKCEKWLEK